MQADSGKGQSKGFLHIFRSGYTWEPWSSPESVSMSSLQVVELSLLAVPSPGMSRRLTWTLQFLFGWYLLKHRSLMKNRHLTHKSQIQSWDRMRQYEKIIARGNIWNWKKNIYRILLPENDREIFGIATLLEPAHMEARLALSIGHVGLRLSIKRVWFYFHLLNLS